MALSPTNGSNSTPDSAANVEPISQAIRRTRIGLMACIGDQVRVVDHRAHREPATGETEQREQQEHADDGDDGDPQLRVGDVDPTDLEAVRRLGQELLDPNGVRAVLDGRPALARASTIPTVPTIFVDVGWLASARAKRSIEQPEDRPDDEHGTMKDELPVQPVVDVERVEE